MPVDSNIQSSELQKCHQEKSAPHCAKLSNAQSWKREEVINKVDSSILSFKFKMGSREKGATTCKTI